MHCLHPIFPSLAKRFVSILECLSLQINEYSKYTNPMTVVQDITSNAQAVCTDDLREYLYNNKNKLFFSFIAIIPVAFMVIIVVMLRRVHPHIDTILTESTDYRPVLAGFALTGTHLLLFILSMDVAAIVCYSKGCYKTPDKHDLHIKGAINLRIIFITFAFDAIILLQFLAFMLYPVLPKCITSCCILPYFYAVFGSEDKKVKTPENINVWIVIGMMAAPLLALASHAGYLLLAWVTEPARTTGVFLVGLGSLVFLFFMLKESYAMYTSREHENCKWIVSLSAKHKWIVLLYTIPFVLPLWTIVLHLASVVRLWCFYFKQKTPHERKPLIVATIEATASTRPAASTDINFPAYCRACSWGLPAVGMIAFTITAFYSLPLPTFLLGEYLEHFLQITIVVGAFLLTYKFFSTENAAAPGATSTGADAAARNTDQHGKNTATQEHGNNTATPEHGNNTATPEQGNNTAEQDATTADAKVTTSV